MVGRLEGGGHRFSGNGTDRPLVTIVTSTFRARSHIERTAASIRAQTFPGVQWIVADGGSTDGTVEWLRKNEDLVDVWFSAPDRGIYDAWNKAVPYARGEWIQFLGAGDELASPDVIGSLAPVLDGAHPAHDLVYGKIDFVSADDGSVVQTVGEPWERMRGRWEILRPKLPVHPEVFHHRSLFDMPEPFDLRFRIASDSHFLLRSIARKDPLHVPVVVDRMLVGGTSTRYASSLSVMREILAIDRDLGIRPPAGVLVRGIAKAWIRYAVAKCVPAFAARRMVDLVRRARGKGALGGEP